MLYNIISSHIFLDGNKRTAFVCVATFLEINGKKFNLKDDDVLNLVYGVANGKYNISEIEDIIKGHVK